MTMPPAVAVGVAVAMTLLFVLFLLALRPALRLRRQVVVRFDGVMCGMCGRTWLGAVAVTVIMTVAVAVPVAMGVLGVKGAATLQSLAVTVAMVVTMVVAITMMVIPSSCLARVLCSVRIPPQTVARSGEYYQPKDVYEEADQ
eukprot:7839879-Pyramimonas_sp.AAC.1